MSSPPHVLLILPQAARARQLGEYLSLLGTQVTHAESGLQALTQLERLVPDAVVCAAQLEDMSGRELLEILRSEEQFGNVVFLLLGAHEDPGFGIRDAALPGEPTPAEVGEELRPALLSEAGPPGNAAGSQAGNLETLGLGGVLIALGAGRRSGRLTVTNLSSEAEVWLSQGQAVNARYGMLRGEAALLALLAGTRVLLNAEYHFAAQDPGQQSDSDVIATPIRTLLQRAGPAPVSH